MTHEVQAHDLAGHSTKKKELPVNRNNSRNCSWLLCLCGDCRGVPRVKRVKRIELRGELVSMAPKQYIQYRAALQARAWAMA